MHLNILQPKFFHILKIRVLALSSLIGSSLTQYQPPFLLRGHLSIPHFEKGRGFKNKYLGGLKEFLP